jgi:hypothetical protein
MFNFEHSLGVVALYGLSEHCAPSLPSSGEKQATGPHPGFGYGRKPAWAVL